MAENQLMISALFTHRIKDSALYEQGTDKLNRLVSHTSPDGHLRLQFVTASSQSIPQKKVATVDGIGAYV